MTKVICQHSKIEFEAANTRTKQHPLVAAFKNENTKTYREAMQALEKATEIGGYSSVEEYMDLVNGIFTGKIDERNARIAAQNRATREAENARQEAKEQRKRTNALLRQHGYTWSKEDEESMDRFGANAFSEIYGGHQDFVWILTDANGREVSVAQALEEIKNK